MASDTDAAQIKIEFSGRHVLVTDGTSGIGLAIANQFSAVGARVAITGTWPGVDQYNLEDLNHYWHIPLDLAKSTAKAGVTQLTKTMALRYADSGIHCNAVLPGSSRTKMTEMFIADSIVHDAVCARTPHRRWGEPGEIVTAVQFLSAGQSGFETGHTLVVDGGYLVIDAKLMGISASC